MRRTDWLMAGVCAAALCGGAAWAQDTATDAQTGTDATAQVPEAAATGATGVTGATGADGAVAEAAENAVDGTEEAGTDAPQGAVAEAAPTAAEGASSGDAASQALVEGAGVAAGDAAAGVAADQGTMQDGAAAQDAQAGTDQTGAQGVTAGDRGPLAGIIATEDGTTVRAGEVVDVEVQTGDGAPATGADAAGDPLTERGADLGELAREADGATIGETDGAGQSPGMDGAGTPAMMLDLEEFGEAFFERGFRQGYIRGLEEGRQRGGREVVERMGREQRMRRQAARTEAQQRRDLGLQGQQGRAQAPGQAPGQGGGAPQFIIVPQGTDMQALMQQLQRMQPGG